MVLLGFRLEKSLQEELENNFENELTFSENISDFIESLKNKKYDTIVIEEKNLQEEALINLIKKVGEYQKRGVIIVLGETSNLKVVAGSVIGLTVQQISEQLQFADQASFSKFFKRHAGVSPQGFRQKALMPE